MVKRDRRLRRRRPAQRWGKRRDEGRFELCLGWRRIRDLSNLGAEGDGGEERFCRAGIGAARYFNPKRGSANLYYRRPFFLGGGRGVAGCYPSIRHTRPPRHDPGLPGAPTFENANESSFICKRICMYYHARVFLAIISHSKRDTPSVHFCKSFQTT